jgi:hypothetical protein
MTTSIRYRLMAVAIGIAGAATAFAQGAQQDVNVQADVPIYCRIDGQVNPAAINTTIPVDAVGIVDTTPQTFTLSNVVCNSATSVQVTSTQGGVKSTTKASSVGPGFTNIINYRGSAEFGTAKSTVNTGTVKGAIGPETGNTETTVGATRGDVTILIRPAQPTSPLVMGDDYSDTLRVTLTPQ